VVEPGRRCLADRYELGQLIASGGMGQVWRGTDVLLGRSVAVKVLRSEYTGDPTFLARFRAEAQHAASLSHPNIALVFDYGEVVTEDGSGETLAFLVMELVEGRPLSAVLREDGPLDPPTTLSLLRQAGLALSEAHRVGMVHRDVKPGNILVRPDGSVKITDFGIAWSAGSVPLTRTGQVIGTPQYLSPEQAEGRLASPASDVYALGLVGYECLAGHSAFDGDNAVTIALKQLREQPEPLPAELPGGLRDLIDRALVKDPAQRLPDGAAFVAALEAVASGRGLPGPRPVAPPTAAVRRPPADPQPSGPVRVPPPRRTWARRSALVLVPLLALFVGAAAAALVLPGVLGGNRSAGTAGTVAAVAADTGGSDTVTLVAADYVGRPVDDVAGQLSAFGLTVQRQQDPTSAAPAGTVTRVDPAGVLLRRGDPVRISYAVPLGYRPTTQRAPRSHTTERSTEEPSATTSAAPTTEQQQVEAGTPLPTSTAPAPTTTTAPTSSEDEGDGDPTDGATSSSSSWSPPWNPSRSPSWSPSSSSAAASSTTTTPSGDISR
jgi:eukaryotic-like serine/threonine-protein kinase